MPSNRFKIALKNLVQAVDTAFYAWNLNVKNKNTKSALEKKFGRKPRSDHLKTFSCYFLFYSDTFASTSKIKNYKSLLALSAIEHFF